VTAIIRSRTIRKESVLFQNPIAVNTSFDQTDPRSQQEFPEQEQRQADETLTQAAVESLSSALPQSPKAMKIKPKASNIVTTPEARNNFKLLEKHSAELFHQSSMVLVGAWDRTVDWYNERLRLQELRCH
jgi:hypothetical protein